MSTSQNVETSKKGYAAFAAGDLETVLSILDDDTEWFLPGNSTISGTYRGKAEVTKFFGKLAEKDFIIAPSRFLADDDVVVVLSIVTASGESAPQADAYSFRDGKIVKAQSFADTAMQERIYGTK
jgi:ketosteroid isomerase-like protein